MSEWEKFDFFKKDKPKKKRKAKTEEKTKFLVKKQVHKQMPIKTYTNKMTAKKQIPYVEEIRIKKPDEFTDDDIKIIQKSLTQDRLWDIKKIIFMQLPLPNVTLSTQRHNKDELLPLFKRIFSEIE